MLLRRTVEPSVGLHGRAASRKSTWNLLKKHVAKLRDKKGESQGCRQTYSLQFCRRRNTEVSRLSPAKSAWGAILAQHIVKWESTCSQRSRRKLAW